MNIERTFTLTEEEAKAAQTAITQVSVLIASVTDSNYQETVSYTHLDVYKRQFGY